MAGQPLPPSPRQLELLCLHAQGMTFEEIGREIFLSRLTVKTHLTELRDRLGARSMPQALALAIAGGHVCIARCGTPFVPTPIEDPVLELVA